MKELIDKIMKIIREMFENDDADELDSIINPQDKEPSVQNNYELDSLRTEDVYSPPIKDLEAEAKAKREDSMLIIDEEPVRIEEQIVDSSIPDKVSVISPLSYKENKAELEKETNTESKRINSETENKEDVKGDAKALNTLASLLIEIINEFDSYSNSVTDESNRAVLKLCQDRIIGALYDSGAGLIEDDVEFDNNRHISMPLKVVNDGTPIIRFVRKGIIWRDKVILKAQVEI